MSEKTILDWARSYCGEPKSHVSRGELIVERMKELGMRPEHRVLDLGCGALSQGAPLIRYLNGGNFVGLDPNGWLMLAALHDEPKLWDKDPTFIHRSDFDATDHGPFDFIVSHSVMSHMAHWQMEGSLAKIRECSREGTLWLSSLWIDQYDMFATEWQYPGISRFRLQTVETLAFYFGWIVTIEDELRQRLMDNNPSDTLQWLCLTAIPTPAEMNERRLQLEADQKHEREQQDVERELRVTFGQSRVQEMSDAMPNPR